MKDENTKSVYTEKFFERLAKHYSEEIEKKTETQERVKQSVKKHMPEEKEVFYNA